MLGAIFDTILYRPLLNALILLYQYLPFHDFGIAVVILTGLLRLILYPLMAQSIKSQKVMTELQPKLQEIQKKYKNDRERQSKETLELYKREKINPWASFLPFLIQIPILFALYKVSLRGLEPEAMASLYSFITKPDFINPSFLGLVDLKNSSLVLALLAGICQFFQTKMVSPPKKAGGQVQKNTTVEKQMAQFTNVLQKEMTYFFPFLTVLILLKLPATVALYWLASSLFSILQQYIVLKPGLFKKNVQNVNKIAGQ